MSICYYHHRQKPLPKLTIPPRFSEVSGGMWIMYGWHGFEITWDCLEICLLPGFSNKNETFQKPGPPIILERFLMGPDVVGIIEGSRFWAKIIDFASRNVIWVCEGSWARIVTINNIDALCGSKRAHASSDQKYHAFWGKIQSPFFGLLRNIMIPS